MCVSSRTPTPPSKVSSHHRNGKLQLRLAPPLYRPPNRSGGATKTFRAHLALRFQDKVDLGDARGSPTRGELGYKDHDYPSSVQIVKMRSKQVNEPPRWRNWIAYWILGLCNNFAYCIMLSAAGDILDHGEAPTPAANGTSPVTSSECIPSLSEQKCSQVSTGAILLADILPTLVVKMVAPFFISRVPFGVRHLFVVIGQALAFITVALSTNIYTGIFGVIIGSIACGIGDLTYIPLSAYHPSYVIGGWSSGTGGAGLIAATSYAILTDSTLAAMKPSDALLSMVVVPMLFAFVYWVILKQPDTVHQVNVFRPSTYLVPEDDYLNHINLGAPSKTQKANYSLEEKLAMIKPLLKYMIPMGIVYFAEYYINQGLAELVVFDCARGLDMSPRRQYRWYQVLYQIGVFFSRTSISFFTLPVWTLPLFAILQMLNVGFFWTEATLRFTPHVLVIFTIILFEGFFGGWSYANTFHAIHDFPEDRREFSMGFATLADAIGIGLSGILAIPTHNFICNRYVAH